MKRFMSVSEIKNMDPWTRWPTVVAMVVLHAIGIAFSVAFYREGAGMVSVIPALGFVMLAWQRR